MLVTEIRTLLPQMYQSVFGYDRFASVTALLYELPSFDTVVSNSDLRCEATDSLLVRHFFSLGL